MNWKRTLAYAPIVLGAGALGFWKGYNQSQGNPISTAVDLGTSFGYPIAGGFYGSIAGLLTMNGEDPGTDMFPSEFHAMASGVGVCGIGSLVMQIAGQITGSVLGKYI